MALRQVEKVGGFFSEFWKFAAKGNAVQLAVAVVLGGAFGAIVNSLVSDIITPLLSIATNNVNFNAWGYTLRGAVTNADGSVTPAVVINYGHLLQASINFLVVGLCIFVIYKVFSGAVKRLQRSEAQKPPEPPTSNEEKLLTEIRDILKSERGGPAGI